MQRIFFGTILVVVVIAVTLMSLSLLGGDGATAQEGEPAASVNDGSLGSVADIVVGDADLRRAVGVHHVYLSVPVSVGVEGDLSSD